MGCREFSVWDPDMGSCTYHHGGEHHSAMRSGLQHQLQCVGKVPPHFCVWTVRQPHCGNVGALPHDYLLWQESKQIVLLAGHLKERKEL